MTKQLYSDGLGNAACEMVFMVTLSVCTFRSLPTAFAWVGCVTLLCDNNCVFKVIIEHYPYSVIIIVNFSYIYQYP